MYLNRGIVSTSPKGCWIGEELNISVKHSSWDYSFGAKFLSASQEGAIKLSSVLHVAWQASCGRQLTPSALSTASAHSCSAPMALLLQPIVPPHFTKKVEVISYWPLPLLSSAPLCNFESPPESQEKGPLISRPIPAYPHDSSEHLFLYLQTIYSWTYKNVQESATLENGFLWSWFFFTHDKPSRFICMCICIYIYAQRIKHVL